MSRIGCFDFFMDNQLPLIKKETEINMNHTLDFEAHWRQFELPGHIEQILDACPSCLFPKSRAEILDLAMGNSDAPVYEVAYDVPGKGPSQATVTRCTNGLAVNYIDPYMRSATRTVWSSPTTKKPTSRFRIASAPPLRPLRDDTFKWLADRTWS